MKGYFYLIAINFALLSCKTSTDQSHADASLYNSDQFKAYWYSGKAEISSYELDQARYGENHKGNAVLIFVTEDFSKHLQVKLDYPEKAADDKINVLKLNYVKNFTTGIYPYSMMLSAFTPVQRNENKNTLKLSMSSQEWCGHVYAQLNFKKNFYETVVHSYFEQEADSKFRLPTVILEDEIFNLIRLDPAKLPTGEKLVIPGLFFSRTKHETLAPSNATLKLEKGEEDYTYIIDYKAEGRSLVINFDQQFPHQIKSWEESYTDSYRKVHQTKAILTKSLITDYWTKNKNEFSYLRDSLDLPLNY